MEKVLAKAERELVVAREGLRGAISALREARGKDSRYGMALVGVINRLQTVVLDVGISVREVKGIQEGEPE